MTSFAYWASRMPEGHFLCCLCFEGKPIGQASRDNYGDLIDVCLACAEQERAALTRRAGEAS